MQPFNAAQAVAGKAMQDAFNSLLDAHNQEVKDLQNQVHDLEQSLSRMQSVALSTKCDDDGHSSIASNDYDPHEMKDIFKSACDGYHCDERLIELSGTKEVSTMEAHVGDNLIALNGAKEADRVVMMCQEASVHNYDDTDSQTQRHEQASRHEQETSPRAQQEARVSGGSWARMSQFLKLSPRERQEASQEAKRITQQVLDLLPPAQRRMRKVMMSPGTELKYEKPYLQKVVEHPIFESGCAFLIVLNSFLVGFDVEWYTTHDVPNMGVEVAGHVCSGGFLIELMLRLKAYKWKFFRGESVLWNIFDAILVVMSMVELLIQSQVDSAAGTASIGSGMKTIKMLRIIRVFRVFRFFKELSLLALMIIDSMKALVWALVMLSIILYVFAICFTVNATEYIKTTDPVIDMNVHQVHMMFGSIPKTVYSLLQTMLGGVSWGVMSDALLKVGWPLAGLFFFYVSFVMLAVLNIITGVFVDNAVETAKSQRDVLVQKEFELKERYLNELRDLFQEMDDDGSGTLTLEEIKEYFADPRVMSYFQALGLDPNDTERLFRLIDDDGSGDVNVEEFLCGCMRLKGGARSIDVHQLLLECKRLDQHVEKLERKMGDLSYKVIKKKALETLVVHSY